jgi:hypothetical protein
MIVMNIINEESRSKMIKIVLKNDHNGILIHILELFVSVLRSNFVKRNALIIYSLSSYRMFCSTNLSFC